jgi:hypothetical protein
MTVPGPCEAIALLLLATIRVLRRPGFELRQEEATVSACTVEHIRASARILS